jgi:hypothetical protein
MSWQSMGLARQGEPQPITYFPANSGTAGMVNLTIIPSNCHPCLRKIMRLAARGHQANFPNHHSGVGPVQARRLEVGPSLL